MDKVEYTLSKGHNLDGLKARIKMMLGDDCEIITTETKITGVKKTVKKFSAEKKGTVKTEK